MTDVSFAAGQRTVPGYLALPEPSDGVPAVVVIHEIHGLNANIRGIAERFAREGYAALAVDLFAGRSRALCMARVMGGLVTGREPFALQDLVASVDYLAARPEVDSGRIGAIGFCMGGGYAIAWARHDDRLRAIAPFYGTNPRPLTAMRRMCPVVGSYPGRDFTAKSGHNLEQRLGELNVPHDIKIYPDAKHSFFNDSGKAYDRAASDDAWERTLAFFGEHIAAPAAAG